jgi:tetratricopeptide (TPR) repeat protein
MLRMIREEEPPKPSTRLSESREQLASISAHRKTEPAKLTKLVRGELDWIVMKALEKDRGRRYETANSLARDIQRYLVDEPVQACPPSTTYKLRKFVRKNRKFLSLAGTFLVLLAGAAVISTWQAVTANLARADLAAKNAELKDEQAKVQARFDMAVKAIETFHTGVSEDMLLKNLEFTELRTKLLKQAAGFYADLEKLLAGQSDANSRKALAAAYFQLGELTDKIGDKKEALAVHRKALALRRELAAAEGVDEETRLDVVRSLQKVGIVLLETNDHAGALAAFEEQRELAERLGAEHSTDAVRSIVASSHYGIALVLSDSRKPEEALEPHRKALAIRQKLAVANPTAAQFQSDLADSQNLIGVVLAQMGKRDEALAPLREALDIRQKLADDNRADTQLQCDLAQSHNNVGSILAQTGKPEEALESYRKELDIRQKLADAYPAVTMFQRLLAASHMGTGAVLVKTGKPEEALESYRKYLAIWEKLADANPSNTEFQNLLASRYDNIVDTLARMGKSEEALKYFEETLQRMKAKHGPNHSATLAALGGVALAYLEVAAQQAWFGQEQEWAATCERALSLAEDTKNVSVAERVAKMCCLRPSNDKRRRAALLLARRAVELGKGNRFLPYFQMARGMAEYRSGNFAEADAALFAAMESGKNHPHIAGTSAFYRAMCLFRQGKPDEARQQATQAAARMKPLPKDAKNPLAGGASDDDLILWLAYQEAKAAIKFDEKSGAGAEPEPPNKAKPKDGSP